MEAVTSITRRPFRGAPQTVAYIQRGVQLSRNHLAVRTLAEKICSELRSKDYLSEYLAVYYYLLTHTRYMRDPRTIELVKSPHIAAEQILNGHRPSLDCDCLAALLGAVLEAVGGDVRILTVAFRQMVHNGEQQFSHVFVQVLEPRTKSWITLDPVASVETRMMHKRVVAAKAWPIA